MVLGTSYECVGAMVNLRIWIGGLIVLGLGLGLPTAPNTALAAEFELDAPPSCPSSPYGNWYFYYGEQTLFNEPTGPITPTLFGLGHMPRPAPYTVHQTKQGQTYLKIDGSPDDPYYKNQTYYPYVFMVYITKEDAWLIPGYRRSKSLPPCLVRLIECMSIEALERASRVVNEGYRETFGLCGGSPYLHEQFVPKK